MSKPFCKCPQKKDLENKNFPPTKEISPMSFVKDVSNVKPGFESVPPQRYFEFAPLFLS